MNPAINTIIAAVVLLSSHVALEKLHSHVKQTTLIRIHQGLPPLTSFANRLTSKPKRKRCVLQGSKQCTDDGKSSAIVNKRNCL